VTVYLPTPPVPLMTNTLLLNLPSDLVIAFSCWASAACWDSFDPALLLAHELLLPPHE